MMSSHLQRLERRFRRIGNIFFPTAIILLYHRVSNASLDPQLMRVTPEHFSEHMQVLRREYQLLTLQSLQRRRAFNFWSPRSVVVTFDDGYADNFHQARNILEAQNIPATVFVTSGKVGTQQEFWWDVLEKIFLCTPTLPNRLEIQIEKKEYLWDFKNTTEVFSPASWNVLAASRPAPRQQAYLDLMKILHDLDVVTRASILLEFAAWAGLDLDQGRQDYLSVKVEELHSLPKDGLIEVGAHTVNHPSLSALSIASQQREIVESKIALEKILDRPVSTFAYPFGERRDYTHDTASLVREAGFSCACSNFTGHVTAMSDPYQLPRFIVRDWDGDTFTKQLRAWFHA